MKRNIILPIAGLAGLATVALLAAAQPKHEEAKSPTKEPVARGKYLAKFAGCASCHTPKMMTDHGPVDDATRLFAGHPADGKLTPPKSQTAPWDVATSGLTAWSGPWGVSYAANLTPDLNTGLGIWTEEMFLKAMRTGKHMGSGRDILPPMPWQEAGSLNDEDLKSIFAYLRQLPVVSNRVPDPVGPDGKPAYE